MDSAVIGETEIFKPGYQEFLAAAEGRSRPLIIPLCQELPLPPVTPPGVYAGLCDGVGFFLESMEGSDRSARYSVIGVDPVLRVSVGETAEISGTGPFVRVAASPDVADPVGVVRSILGRFAVADVGAPRYFGGFVGYFAYDLVHALQPKVGPGRRDGPDAPLARLLLAQDCIVFDHLAGRMYVFSSPLLTEDTDPHRAYEESRARVRALVAKIRALGPEEERPRLFPAVGDLPCRSTFSKEAFEAAVLRMKEHITAGNIFQGVLSRRIDCDYPGDPFAIYRALRAINPGPYMYFLDFGDQQVAGASPEMLVRVEKGKVTTVPIAGTRPRGATPDEDDRLEKDLLADAKERAEHTMLVDLARNDLGRVCTYGSVHLPAFMGVEKYSHVQHIVSTVEGALDGRYDCFDAFTSCFPAGTVSGAPKIRAMQIIDDLEPCRRGIYAGAVGHVGFDGDMDVAIAIRTVVVEDGTASVQVGAGIVADSIPENEWEETGSKAAAMLRAIAYGRRDL
ncbi:MAG: anthranilate synthase component I family protein [Methanofollis sp.]|uniref:anthranilate synthase component I family protein n=1 Tax=Methanofollis sp. TaxID=2052835 RepID=UPI00260FF984|nr:anthranilate synthase component I family protein [Methanofollis sp.]MDD4255885.1 anthranilate synthase component I family protein [Methanofollis sp.]